MAAATAVLCTPDIQLVVLKQAVEVLHQLINLPDDLILHICLPLGLITLLVHNFHLILQVRGTVSAL